MALLCYNKGCGERFDSGKNQDNACLFHAGVPIFHDALKSWSCCRKRTTDFSEFLSIKGCTRGRHSNVKPQEQPAVPSQKKGEKKNVQEIIYRGPKSAEEMQKERPSGDEDKVKLPQKVSASLAQALEKLDISNRAREKKESSQVVVNGMRCKNAGCKTIYQGPETNLAICTHHPGAPVFHEGYKYWSCCCIQTSDFNEFLDQKGCSTDKHRWIAKQTKKKAACRHDWHQTGNNVVVTIYAKNAHPEFSSVEANRTVLTCHIQFENDKVFHKDFHLWGVVDVKQSSVNMVPTKVEILLLKSHPVSWGKLEDPHHVPEPEPLDESVDPADAEPPPPSWDIDDDDISDSDDEWAYDKPPVTDNRADEVKEEEKRQMDEGKQKEEREAEKKKEYAKFVEEHEKREKEEKKKEEEKEQEEKKKEFAKILEKDKKKEEKEERKKEGDAVEDDDLPDLDD